MSYLPRMSETYKEPRSTEAEKKSETMDNILTYKNLKPASALLSEKSIKTQGALRHYRYLPHALPVLPGPSVIDEAMENENFLEKSKIKRGSKALSKTELVTDEPSDSTLTQPSEGNNGDDSDDEKDEFKLRDNKSSSTKRLQLRKTNKSNKSLSKKKMSSKSLVYKKQSSKKLDNVAINMCLVGFELPKDFTVAPSDRKFEDIDEVSETLDKSEANSREPSSFQLTVSGRSSKTTTLRQTLQEVDKLKTPRKEYINRSVQCTIFGSFEKIFVIPTVVNSLLQALAFLLHELNREDVMTHGSNDRRRLMPQIQLILGDLCAQTNEEGYGFDTTYSDSKRVEQILYDLKKYIKDVYGAKEEHVDKMEDLKRVFLELKKKELEVGILEDKIKEYENPSVTELEIKESDFKSPEVTLQNKRLESEQLLAEIEFSSREINKYQKVLAESEWEIKTKQDQVVELKRLRSAKSKTEDSGKKGWSLKYSSETSTRSCKSREGLERSNKKKT